MSTAIQKTNLACLVMAMAIATLVLSSCSQSRSGIGKKKVVVEEIWQQQEVCQNIEGARVYGCFSVAPNITTNSANIEVIDLGIDPLQNPYRVLARRPNDTSFTLLADNLSADVGRTFTVNAKKGHKIQEYDEWRFESTKVYGADGITLVTSSAGSGVSLSWVRIIWPELSKK